MTYLISNPAPQAFLPYLRVGKESPICKLLQDCTACPPNRKPSSTEAPGQVNGSCVTCAGRVEPTRLPYFTQVANCRSKSFRKSFRQTSINQSTWKNGCHKVCVVTPFG
ncbi:hypothetical protein [Candidatus Seribacter sulfatis]|uniref:hypothetical protein n=1 Tax=Candidatus Seribacter sulfatis TaxID=3381756 RepID=UPI00389A795C